MSTITLLVLAIETLRASHVYAPPLLWPTMLLTLGVAHSSATGEPYTRQREPS